jgi:hypothetical protein
MLGIPPNNSLNGFSAKKCVPLYYLHKIPFKIFPFCSDRIVLLFLKYSWKSFRDTSVGDPFVCTLFSLAEENCCPFSNLSSRGNKTLLGRCQVRGMWPRFVARRHDQQRSTCKGVVVKKRPFAILSISGHFISTASLGRWGISMYISLFRTCHSEIHL